MATQHMLKLSFIDLWQGASWSLEKKKLEDADPLILFQRMPPIRLLPKSSSATEEQKYT